MNILRHIVNIIYPGICKLCGDTVSGDAVTSCFCNTCWEGIKWFDSPCCPRCGLPYPSMESLSNSCQAHEAHLCSSCHKNPPHFDSAISAGPYEGTLSEAIKLFKYKKKIHIGKALAHSIILHDPPLIKGDYIIPVPLHPRRLREREFNQSAIIALLLGRRLGIPLLTDVLIRHRHTKPQVELDMMERSENIRGVFTVKNGEKIAGKYILLIDDVMTTGSTVNECSRMLKENGASRVYVVTIARMVTSI